MIKIVLSLAHMMAQNLLLLPRLLLYVKLVGSAYSGPINPVRERDAPLGIDLSQAIRHHFYQEAEQPRCFLNARGPFDKEAFICFEYCHRIISHGCISLATSVPHGLRYCPSIYVASTLDAAFTWLRER